MLLALLAPALAADFVLGVDHVPMGRADLVWVDEDRTSGTGLGEFDGLVRPPLTVYGGLSAGRHTLLVGLGLALERTTTWTASSRRTVSAGGVRPSIDYQRALRDRLDRVRPWVGAGLYGTVPFAADRSTAYSEEESDDAGEGAAATRRRIGGAGGRVGLGADATLIEGVDLGFRLHLVAHNGWSATEDEFAWSTLAYGEAGLRLQVRWP